MKTFRTTRFARPAGVCVAVAALLWLPAHAASAASASWLDPSDFMPHGYCYLWDPVILGLHVISDAAIALSYFCIPIGLIYLVRKRADLPFNWIFAMFGLFILGCGTTHLMEIWTVWHASYLLAGIFKAFTAAVSVVTAVMLIPLIPKAIALPSVEQFRLANQELQMQMAARTRLAQRLQETLEDRDRTLASLGDYQTAAEELRLAQDALRESEERVNAIIQSATDAIVTVDDHQLIVVFNGAAERMFGMPAEEALGQPLEQFIPARFRSRHSGHISHFAETGVSSRTMGSLGALWAVRSSGEEFQIEASIAQVESRGKKLFTVILRDITERIRIEEARKSELAASEQARHDLADQKFALDQHAIVATTDVQGTITYVNDKFCAISKYSREELLGKNHRILNSGHHPREFFQQMYHAIANGNVWRGEICNRAKDNSLYWVDTTIVPFLGSDGKPRQYMAIRAEITERKRIEMERHEAEERFRLLLDGISDYAIYMLDPEGQVASWNAGAARIKGYQVEEILGKHFSCFYTEQDRALGKPAAELQQALTNGRYEDQSWRMRKNGSGFWANVVVTPLYSESGALRGFCKVVRDISERKTVERTLREQARVLDLAQVLIRDMDNRIVTWNLGAQQLYGYSAEEALGQFSHELLRTQFPVSGNELDETLRKTGRWEGELTHRRKDGSQLVVASVQVLYRDEQGNAVRILEANNDITGRKKTEEQLAAQAEELSHKTADLETSESLMRSQGRMLQLVLDSMGEGLIAADENGRFILWNQSALKILGRGPSETPKEEWGKHFEVFLSDGVTTCPTADLPMIRAIAGEVNQSELIIGNPVTGQKVCIEITGHPLRGDGGVVQGGVVAFRDITQRKADERQIKDLNQSLERRVIERTAQLEAANKELEAFTYSVSHDLRAPLRHISGFTRILSEEFGPSLPAEAQHHLMRVEHGAQRMGQLVDELLNLARVGRQALSVQFAGLESIVKDVLILFEPELKGRAVEWKIGDLPSMECDPILMRQVFQNLIGNALKYSRPRSPAVIEIGQTVHEAQTVIFVRDNGVGFSMKYADKLFGVFQRLHRPEDFEGTGVGLALVHRIIAKHGGQIWAEAELDRGATFYFTLSGAERSDSKTAASAGGI